MYQVDLLPFIKDGRNGKAKTSQSTYAINNAISERMAPYASIKIMFTFTRVVQAKLN